MAEKVYVDGILNTHFISDMVRLDFFTFEPKEGGEPDTVPTTELIMSPQAFVHSLNAMQQLANKMVESGVLQATQQ